MSSGNHDASSAGGARGGGRGQGGAQHRDRAPSQSKGRSKGATWDKRSGRWKAQCSGTYLGCFATQEAAAAAYETFVEDGVDPVKRRRRDGTSSQFKGVIWVKRSGKWRAECSGTYLGCHATEEAAAQAGADTRPLFSST
jgi:hypothetical protein